MAHFSFASFIQIGLLFVLICWTKESSGNAFSLEEEFKQLKENYIQMKEIVKNLESEMSEVKAKDVQMRDKTTNLENKVAELEDKISQQDSLLFDLLQEKNERTAAAAANQSAVAINELPSSCGDLKMIGHIWSGFYSIKGAKMMESVYCDFSKLPTDPNFQKWIGFNDVKSTPVHFNVQCFNLYDTLNTPIPFQVEVVNDGNAMNLQTGIFTAPRPGIYFFSFTGLAQFSGASIPPVFLRVSLYLNGGKIGSGWVEESNTVTTQNHQLTVQSTMNLKSGDQVWVAIWSISPVAYLYENGDHLNQFTGFMLEEEIVASL